MATFTHPTISHLTTVDGDSNVIEVDFPCDTDDPALAAVLIANGAQKVAPAPRRHPVVTRNEPPEGGDD